MDPLQLLLVYGLVIIAVSIIGGALPLLRKWNESQLHLMTALSAGVFIGATFIILVPEAVDAMEPSAALILVMLGFVTILLIEVILEHRHQDDCCDHTSEHQHALTSTTAFIGLAVHSAMDGFALGVAVVVNQEIGIVVFLAILAHKAIDLFSLSTIFCLAGYERKRTLKYLIAFSFITPVAAAIALPLLEVVQGFEVGIPLALAGGTFMYVGIYDLLPEAFHEEHSGYRSFALVAAGIMLMFLIGAALESSGI